MADPKRIQLDAPKALQREKKVKEIPPTYRFDLKLNNRSTGFSSEYSYAELVKEARSTELESKQSGSDDPFSIDEDVEKLQEIARKFEEKYNPKAGKKKKKKMTVSEDYVDKGMGYDETDPFIDNGEAYDELVPSSLTTQFGGFYINKGDLEFRNNSESESGNDYKPRKKRIKHGMDKEKKKRRIGNEENLKRRGRKPLNESVSALIKPKKKAQLTVADMLQQAKANIQRMQNENMQQLQLNPIEVEREVESDEIEEDNVEPPLEADPRQASTISEAIESVVKAAAEDVTSNGSAGLITGSSDGEEAKVPLESLEAPKLPENLPQELDVVVAQLKEAAYRSEEGKCKFFSDEVNRMLLSVELKAQELSSAQRSVIYAHLASHLPCTKETLQKRAKKLRLDQEDGKLREPMQRLRDGIAAVMPEMIDKYTASVQAYEASHKEEEKKSNIVGGTDGEESQEGSEKKLSQFPKKRFEWNDKIRKYLCDVVSIKLKCYEVSKTRIQSAEEYLKHFLEAEVKNLWPSGWMQSRILFRESRAAHIYLTNRPKKQILVPKKLNSPMAQMTPVLLTMKPAVSILNNNINTQESDYDQNFHDKSVPSISSVENLSDKRENVDLLTSNNGLSSEERAELVKLFALPYKSAITDEFSVLNSQDNLAISSKLTSEFSLPPKTPSPHHVNTLTENMLGSKLTTPKNEKHSKLTQHNKHAAFSSKVPDFNTFAEGSLASDMLARIICASLADFPYAGSQNVENASSKSASVISPNPSIIKENRTLSSKYSNDSHTSPKKIESKSFNLDARKSSHDSVHHNFSSHGSIESYASAKNQSIQRPSDPLNKNIGHTENHLAVNLKLKDSIVPHSRQFAEAFEKTADIPAVQKHNHKNMKFSTISPVTMTTTSSRLMSEHINDYPTSTSPRTSLENAQKVAFDLAKYNSVVASQGSVSAPYKKRSKYGQSSKASDQWTHFLDANLTPSLLEGMKGFPFPIGTLPTPPPAHSSSPHRTTSHSQHNSSRTASHISPGLRSIHESKSDTSNHNTQAHSIIVSSSDIQRRQSLIQGPWKSSSSQSPSTSLSHFMTSTSPPVSNSCKSTSPSNHHSSNSHANMSPVPAHSMSQIEKASSAFNRSHSPLPLRASPSHMTLSLSNKTSSPSNSYPHLGTTSYTTHQSSHTVSSTHHQTVVRNTFESSNLTTSSSSNTGTYTTNQEMKTVNPRTS